MECTDFKQMQKSENRKSYGVFHPIEPNFFLSFKILCKKQTEIIILFSSGE